MTAAADYQRLEAEILGRLDISAEAERLGVQFSTDRISADGWRECHAIDRGDNNPSAAINVESDNGLLGKYKDLGGDEKAISFFELAYRLKPGQFADFRVARDHYAKQTGVDLPGGKRTGKKRREKKQLHEAITEQLKTDRNVPEQLAVYYRSKLPECIAKFCEAKPGIEPAGIMAADPAVGQWVGQFKVFAINAYREFDKPCAVVLARADGKTFPEVKDRKGRTVLGERKVHTLSGSVDGLIVAGGPEQLASAKAAWLVEGVTDFFTLASRVPDGHAVATNSQGAGAFHESHGPKFEGLIVNVVMDADKAGLEGLETRLRVIGPYAAEFRKVLLPYEIEPKHGKDLRDFFVEGGTFEQLQELADNTEPAEVPTEEIDDREEILVTSKEHEVNDSAVAALNKDSNLFQRCGALVHVARSKGAKDNINRVEQPRVSPIPVALLRDKISRFARFVKETEGGERKPVHPPEWCAKAVLARGQWDGIRELSGIATLPILRPDGSLFIGPGYDDQTGYVLVDCPCDIDVSCSPSQADAVRSADLLCGLVGDFPFETLAHRAAWIALLLTVVARQAFGGPSPLFLIDSNVRGSGKSLLADLVSLIVTGRDIARMSNPRDDDEARKRITAIALAADLLVLIDNIVGGLGCASLDAAITGTTWRDRILGRSEVIEAPLRTVWCATGNNVVMHADTSRRVLHIRLRSPLENPESRSDFKRANIRQFVRDHRCEFLTAALTMVRGYLLAEKPAQGLSPWGSFEGWSSVVRQALVWAGLPDPVETRQEFMQQADREAQALAAVLETWPEGKEFKSSELHTDMVSRSPEYPELCEALAELCPASGSNQHPSARQIGTKLSHVRLRVIGGRMLDYKEGRARTRSWFVVDNSSDCEIESPQSPESGNGDCGGNGDTVSLGARNDVNRESYNTRAYRRGGEQCHHHHQSHQTAVSPSSVGAGDNPPRDDRPSMIDDPAADPNNWGVI